MRVNKTLRNARYAKACLLAFALIPKTTLALLAALFVL